MKEVNTHFKLDATAKKMYGLHGTNMFIIVN